MILITFSCREQSFFVPASPPRAGGWPKMQIISKRTTSSTNVLFTLEISGPDHMSMFIEPVNNAKLVDWSFDKIPINEKFEPPYFVYFSYALDPTPLRFNLEFKVFNKINKFFTKYY